MSAAPLPHVAVVGTGRMGAAMAVRLSEANADLVVYNRTRSSAYEVARTTQADLADTARVAAAGADVVLVSLADDEAVLATYEGSDGLAAGLREGVVVVETSTVDPQTITRLQPLVERRGAALLDAPVSGSVPLVERGELTFMAGGELDALDRARPVLDVLAGQVFHIGAQGSGAVLKLAVNAIVFALNQALAEALVLAERGGVDRAIAYDVFADSAVGAPFVHYKRAAFVHPDYPAVAFSLDLVAKDLELITRLGERVGAPLHQTAVNRDVVRAAVAAGLGSRDMSAVATLLTNPR